MAGIVLFRYGTTSPSGIEKRSFQLTDKRKVSDTWMQMSLIITVLDNFIRSPFNDVDDFRRSGMAALKKSRISDLCITQEFWNSLDGAEKAIIDPAIAILSDTEDPDDCIIIEGNQRMAPKGTTVFCVDLKSKIVMATGVFEECEAEKAHHMLPMSYHGALGTSLPHVRISFNSMEECMLACASARSSTVFGFSGTDRFFRLKN